jgi:hypothetical protein
MIRDIVNHWRQAFSSRTFVIQLAVTLVCLLVLYFVIGPFFAYVQSVPGKTLNDPVLASIRAEDMSVVIFTLIYSSLIAGILYFITSPLLAIRAGLAYIFITLMRMTTLFLFPLEPDPQIILLKDPFVDSLFYEGQVITKDLFFSGHVAVLAMLAFVSPNFWLKRIFGTVALMVGVALLVQHAHYTIDVVAAPVFAWVGTLIVGRVAHKIPQPSPNGGLTKSK